MGKITGDAMLIEKEPYQVEIKVADYIIRGTYTIFKGESILTELNHEKRFIELTRCEMKDTRSSQQEKHARLIVNKSFIELLKIVPGPS